MKILILSGLYPHNNNKYAAPFIIKRLEQLNKNNIDFDIYSIISVDSFFVRILKYLKRKEIVEKQENLIYDNFEWNFINLKNTIFDEFIKRNPNINEYQNNYKKLKKHLDLEKYDLVYCHKAYPTASYAKLIKEEFGIPYIVSSHGTEIHTNPFKDKVIATKTAEVLNFADHCIFVSNKLKEYADKFGFNNKHFSIVPNGIDSQIFKRNEVKKENLIGFVGNLIKVKGADRLPEIFNEINKLIKDIKFIIVGDGELKSKIEKELKKYKIENVNFTGRLNQEEVAKLMNEMKVLIVPSRNEGWPCVILEANSCGTYVIGTIVGGIPEAIGEYGSIIEYDNEIERRIANEVLQIIKNGYNEQSIIKRTESYTWKNIVKQEIEIIKKL